MPAHGAAAHVGATAPGGSLDRFGRAVLAFVDYRVVSLAVLVLVLLFIIVGRIHRGKFHQFGACVKVLEACGLIVTGLVVGVVFLLTNPPAVDELSRDVRGAIGLAFVILSLYFGLKTIYDAYHHD